MTGPEHYQAGEKALEQAARASLPDAQAATFAAIALAHFSAANTAATALAAVRMTGSGWANMSRDLDGWRAAVSAG